ncbi:MAG: histidine phosphatase family protein [Pseudomonadales bacterium]|nr:histidine phosphatase family protein [Pseudomonadales bacterium]
MSELFLVRHAQASFGNEDYDQLSALGRQQSSWLGEYFKAHDIQFDRVFSGTLRRQQHTASTLLEAAGQPLQPVLAPELNEFDFHLLGKIYCAHAGVPPPSPAAGPRPFFQLLRLAILAWSEDKLRHSEQDAAFETWADFRARAQAALATFSAAGRQERLLAVSSGGLIAMILMQALQCSVEAMINLNMQINNTGITHLYLSGDKVILSRFNNIPHLDHPLRYHAKSHA